MSKPTIRIVNLDFRSTLTPINKNRVTKIVQHHMAHPSWNIHDVHNAHKNSRGWNGIGYNFWIAFDGTIYQGRGMNIGAHVTGFNSTTIGIGYQGDFTKQSMTDAQLVAGATLNKWLISQFPNVKSVQDIVGHGDIANTACPGRNFRMSELRQLANRGVTFAKNYLELNDTGAKVKELQEKLIKVGYKLPKYGVDSHYGNETESAVKQFQRDHNLTIDGLYGKSSEQVLTQKLKDLEGGLTEVEAKKLQEQIDELKTLLSDKLDKPSDTNEPSDWAKEDWERAVYSGYYNSGNPKMYQTREQSAKIVNKQADKIREYITDPLEKRIEQLESEVEILKNEKVALEDMIDKVYNMEIGE